MGPTVRPGGQGAGARATGVSQRHRTRYRALQYMRWLLLVLLVY